MKILLIRHGKTIYNEEKRYTGRTDVSLSETGKKELKDINIDLENCMLYTSSLKRTKETAKILFPYKEIDASFKAFDEMNMGVFETHTYEELKNIQSYRDWLDNIKSYKCPKGESFIEFKFRVVREFKKLVNTGNDFCLVSHGGVVSLIISEVVNPELDFFDVKVKNGKGFIINLDDSKYTCEEIQ